MAASLTKSGVSKSGSPAERPITSMPARFSSLTRPVMARVALGWMRPRAADVCDMETFPIWRSEEHTSELQSLMRTSYAVFCLKKNKQHIDHASAQHDRQTLTQ